MIQRAPVCGTVSGSVRLDSEPDCPTVAERSELCEAEDVDSSSPLATPESLTYTMSARYVSLLRDVVFWPHWGTVVDSESRLVLDSVFDVWRLRALERNAIFRRYPIVDCDVAATTISLGPAWDNHYHWLIDSLPRVLGLHHPLVAALPVVRLFVCGKLPEDRQRLLAALLPPNVEVSVVSPRTRIRAKRFVLLPFLASDRAGYLPAAYHQFFQPRAFDAFGVDPPAVPTRRILISREGAPKRRITNQRELEEKLSERRIESVRLESLSLREQMTCFASAELIVAPHGAGLTNLLFASRCKVLEIVSSPPLNHYRLLAAGLNQPYGNLLCDVFSKNADWTVSVPAILDRLDAIGVD
jgi:hypothetical protein